MNRVINDFGSEWEKFNYLGNEHAGFIDEQFRRYLSPLPSNFLSLETTIAADFGAGSGRWTRELAKRVKIVHCIEPSDGAFKTLALAFKNNKKVVLHQSSIQDLVLDPNSLDFAMSLGVLHHIEETQDALNRIFSFLKPGGQFLGYLYYNFENKPKLYQLIWKFSSVLRNGVSHLPTRIKVPLADLIAYCAYWPLARFSKVLSKIGIPTENLPLHQYSKESIYVMRNDALDRFGTRLEKRFSKADIVEMLSEAGANPASIDFSPEEPFWCFSASKSS